jgi:hypothetical protein
MGTNIKNFATEEKEGTEIKFESGWGGSFDPAFAI